MEADGSERTQLGNKTPDQLEIIIGFLLLDVQTVTEFFVYFLF